MADDREQQQVPGAREVGAAAAAGAQPHAPVAQDATGAQAIKQQRGGRQEDQLSGETQKGAHNDETRGANPQGNKPDRNQSARQKGDSF